VRAPSVAKELRADEFCQNLRKIPTLRINTVLRVAHPSWFWKGGAFGFAGVGLGKKEILRRFAPLDDGQGQLGDVEATVVTSN
jgi:hypothetical protein